MAQHLPLLWSTYATVSIKLQDTPKLIHHQVLKIIKFNIFLRPVEVMFENWQQLAPYHHNGNDICHFAQNRCYNIFLSGIPSATLTQWQQHLPIQHNGTTSAIVVVNLHQCVHKNYRTHQHSYIIKC